jgi:hypothetical protein
VASATSNVDWLEEPAVFDARTILVGLCLDLSVFGRALAKLPGVGNGKVWMRVYNIIRGRFYGGGEVAGVRRWLDGEISGGGAVNRRFVIYQKKKLRTKTQEKWMSKMI